MRRYATDVFNRVSDTLSPYWPGIKMGVVVGLVVSQGLIIYNQSEQLKQSTQTDQRVVALTKQIDNKITSDNKAREQARKESIERDLKVQSFIRCLFEVFVEANNNDTKIAISSVDTCTYTQEEFEAAGTTPPATQPAPSNTVVTQNPGSSGNGGSEPPRPGFFENARKTVEDIINFFQGGNR